MNKLRKNFDFVIIGGGFYGCIIALYLRKYSNNILIIEKEKDLLIKASQNNQARVHNGYHYPRSLLTALRSHINFSKFVKDFKVAIDDNFLMTYAISSNNSKVTTHQFIKFCKQIGAPFKLASSKTKRLFDMRMIEEVFEVEEAVYDVNKIRKMIRDKLKKEKISILYEAEVRKIMKSGYNDLKIVLSGGEFIEGKQVINCTYSQINAILINSQLPKLPLKYELTEMPLVDLPIELRKMGITIMDGPFFSILPFPSRNLHSLHHVRYTPMLLLSDKDIKDKKDLQFRGKTKFLFMIKDAQRYIPLLKNTKYIDSIYEIKTILSSSEFSDSRPILYRENYGLKNLHIVMGGKIDNIYDIIEGLKI